MEEGVISGVKALDKRLLMTSRLRATWADVVGAGDIPLCVAVDVYRGMGGRR